jgi:beta-glucosidase
MPQATYHFPAGFVWGSATSSYQVEGGNENSDWSDWENQSGRVENEGHCGLACDWWNGRWREDLDRAAETGQKSHRLSLEWSRIQPAPERWDEDALDRYRQILRGMHERGMQPMVTLHHFTLPRWFAEQGGWENEDAPRLFAAFARRVVTALKEYTSCWVTINEPNVIIYRGYMEGAFPPGKNDPGAAYHALLNLIRSHAAAYQVIHELQPEAQVGVAHQYHGFLAARPWSPLDAALTALNHIAFNDSFPRALFDGRVRFLHKRTWLAAAAGTQDFFGLNYYVCEEVSFRFAPKDLFQARTYPPEAEPSRTGFNASYPPGMTLALEWANRYRLPIIITENGIEDSQDHLRRRFLLSHLHQVWHALNRNMPIRGYYHWSLVDNFEWERGWTLQFGLWELNAQSQSRQPRPSADLYAAICKENAISYAMVEKHAPTMLPDLFPA